jgi:hypothetical protein
MFVQLLTHGAILATVGFLILLAMPLIIRRLYSIALFMMPAAFLCSLMTVRSEVLIGLLLAYLAIEAFSRADIPVLCGPLFPGRFGFTIVVSSRGPCQFDEEAPDLFPFFPSFASRAPPVF